MSRLLVHIATGPENPTREHVDALVAGGATLYASGLSSKARGLTADALGGLAVTMAPPDRLVELAFSADRVLSY